MNLAIVFTAVCVLALLVALQRESMLGIWITKPLASAGFVATAVMAGALQSNYGLAVFIALILGMLGDVLLIPKNERAFLAGLVSFLFGHIGFCVAFVVRGMEAGAFTAVMVAAAVVSGLIARWLLPQVKAQMRAPVLAYVLVISVMVALAAGTVGAHGRSEILVGALAFYASDISVALDKFVRPAFINKLWGIPLYYGAQLLMAWSVSG